MDEQAAALMTGTAYGDEVTGRVMMRELRERLALGRPLRVYLGIDATARDLHLGHTVPLRKLAQFQQFGHEVAFLIGDFTATIGDPTDRDKTRPQLTREQVLENVEAFSRQAFTMLDPDRTAIRYNSEWLAKLSFGDIIRLASSFTVAQFLDRENFFRRYQRGDSIYLHEFFYPLMQGYDAVALRADVQLGGMDQTFNIMGGRHLQEVFGQRPQIMLTMPILPGTDGQMKMSKSLDNAIPIETEPQDMYGKLMSVPDVALSTYVDLLGSDRLRSELQIDERHPRDLKMALAREVTAGFHGAEAADRAENYFVTVFQRHERPADIPVQTLGVPRRLIELIFDLGLARSRNEARRLIEQGGVYLDDDRVTDLEAMVAVDGHPRLLRVGKRHFVELRPE